MMYLISQYWPFLIAALALGIVTGWWSEGVSRRRKALSTEDEPVELEP